jgi:hypothetical protein
MDIFIGMRDMREAGIDMPYEYRNHLKDMFYYDGRYYTVYDYRVRGRLKDDVFILVTGQELYIDQEFINDTGPEVQRIDDFPWPAGLPIIG